MLKIILIQIILLIVLAGCDYVDNRLVITNSSNNPIAVAFSNDTTPPNTGKTEYYIATALKPNETRSFSKPGNTEAWPLYAQMGNSKKISFYFYNIEILKKYSDMDYINKNRLFINKIDYSEEELNKIKWVIKYP